MDQTRQIILCMIVRRNNELYERLHRIDPNIEKHLITFDDVRRILDPEKMLAEIVRLTDSLDCIEGKPPRLRHADVGGIVSPAIKLGIKYNEPGFVN